MIKLFFDIETLPCADEHKDRFLGILKKKNGNSEKSDEELHSFMSFDGAFGRICCIGYIKEQNERVIGQEVIYGTEKELLGKFWDIARNVNQFIGHNIYEFDLPFIYKRSLINSVRPRYDISFARYRNVPIFDTMREWDLWGDQRKAVSLDLLASVFGLKSSKDEMDGSHVWQYYKDGKHDDIYKYCMKDVVLSREVYYKMMCKELLDTALTSSSDAATEEIPF